MARAGADALSNISRNGYPEIVDACRAPVLDHCGKYPSPVKAPGGENCAAGCLFDLEADESESVNLFRNAFLAHVVASMTVRVAELGLSGPAWAFPVPEGSLLAKQLADEMCLEQDATGFTEPVRTSLPPPPAAGPTGPAAAARLPHYFGPYY